MALGRALTPAFSCGGLSPFTFVILILNYLMLGHNPTTSKVRPRLLQRVVRWPPMPPGGDQDLEALEQPAEHLRCCLHNVAHELADGIPCSGKRPCGFRGDLDDGVCVSGH